MMYQYNFSFLNEWLDANPDIPKGEILQALGAKSNNRFKAWIRCEGPMPSSVCYDSVTRSKFLYLLSSAM